MLAYTGFGSMSQITMAANMMHTIAALTQVPEHNIHRHIGPSMAEMSVIVQGRAADMHTHLLLRDTLWRLRTKAIKAARQIIEDPQRHMRLSSII